MNSIYLLRTYDLTAHIEKKMLTSRTRKAKIKFKPSRDNKVSFS